MPINRLTAKSITPTFVTDRLGFTPRSETDVDNQISALVDSAPEALDTLNELAAALGDDANFASTVTTALGGKQATLVSGTNIKTVNNTSLLGSGNITVSASEATYDTAGTVYGLTNTSNTGLGRLAQTNDSNAVAVGFSTVASTDCVALGYDAHSFNAAIAVGSNSRASGTEAIAIGTNALVNNQSWGIAIGANSQAPAGGIAIGKNAWTQSLYSVRIGYSQSASYSGGLYGQSIGIGWDIKDNGYNAIVLNSGTTSFSVPGNGFYVTNVTSATTSDILYYDATTKKITYGVAPAGGGDLALGDLTNVTITNPTSGQVLKYNGTAWVNGTDETGDGGDEGGGGGGQVTSGSGVTYFSAASGPNSFGNVSIFFNTPTSAATFYNTVTQNLTAISAISQDLSQGASAFIRMQAPSVSWQGSPALCSFNLNAQGFTYTAGNDYVSGTTYMSTSMGSGSGNWTYEDQAFGWTQNVNTFSYGGGQGTVNFYNPTAADIYTVATIIVPKPPIKLGIAGYLTNNFQNTYTAFGGVALSGSSPTSSTQFNFTYTSVNFETSTQGNYVVMSGDTVIPT